MFINGLRHAFAFMFFAFLFFLVHKCFFFHEQSFFLETTEW